MPDTIATHLYALKFTDAPGKAFMMAKDVIIAAEETYIDLLEKLKTFVQRSQIHVQVHLLASMR